MEGFNGALDSRVGAFSYQSLMPAVAGTPRYENRAALVGGSVLGSLVPPLDSGFRRNDESGGFRCPSGMI